MNPNKYTAGPWEWVEMGGIKLVGQHGHRPIIMDFVREGMQGATLRLRNSDCIMDKFDPNHPDAKLLKSAPILPILLAACKCALARNNLEEWQQEQILAAIKVAEKSLFEK